MSRVGRVLLPAGLISVAMVMASCAPAPTPAKVAPAIPACAASTLAAAADPPTADPDAAGAGVVVVAVDDAGRPEIVSTDPGGAAVASASLEADPTLDVVAVEPDRPMTTDGVAVATGGDPYRSQQWGLDELHAETLWPTSTGAGIDVAVVDTGVIGTHRDFAGRICSGVSYLGSTGVAQVGHGIDDGNGHGTHVAGIAAAGTGDGVGIAGVAPSARIIPVRVLDSAGSGSSSDVARGITWAVDHGAEVINLSLGGPYSIAVATAVDYAESHGVLVVAAAGNGGPGGAVNYPAALDDALAVGAHDEGGDVSWFSTRGSYVDVSAPGSGIVSTYKDGSWSYMSGTSMASPHVAGAAAVLLAAEPGLTPAQLRARIVSSAADRGPIGHDTSFGWGLMDLPSALAG